MRAVPAKAQNKKESAMPIRLAVSAAVLVLASCASGGSDPYMRPTPTQATAQAESGVEPPDWMKVIDYRHGGPVPPMEPNRKVNEQSCTQGVPPGSGNLKCR
jgi:hypothetical protein